MVLSTAGDYSLVVEKLRFFKINSYNQDRNVFRGGSQMNYEFDKGRGKIINQVADVINQKLPKEKAELLTRFVQKFYRTVAADDLRRHTVMDLYGAGLSFWEFISERELNEIKIRVYNPHYETDAWQSSHTIIEIITDDMPFLLDSVLMEINRRNLTCHLVMHMGGLRVCRDEKKSRYKNI